MDQSEQHDGARGRLPDEDRFTVPDAWREHVHPRRGGLPGPSTAVDPRAAEAIRRRLAKVQDRLNAALDHGRNDPELAQAARDQLHGRANPLGAAVLAALIWSLSEWDEGKCERFTDAWAAQHGLIFAARATAELSRVLVLQEGRKNPAWVGVLDDDMSAEGFEDIEGTAHRTRELLAAASDEEYARAVTALADHRVCQYQRVVVSYLVPTEQDWADELLSTPLAVSHARLSPMLLGTLGSAEHLGLLREHQGHAWLGIPRAAHTVAEAVGPALTSTLVTLLDEDLVVKQADRQAVYAVLAALPGDPAFAALAGQLGRRGAQSAVAEAARRFPARALRLLPEVASGGSRRAGQACRLLRNHLNANPDLFTTLAPTLSDQARRTINTAMRARGWVPEAPSEALPHPLVRSPWSGDATATSAAEPIDVFLLPQLLLSDRRQALPQSAVPHLITMLILAGSGDHQAAGAARAGVDLVKELCDPDSLDEFACALLQQTAAAGEAAAWALYLVQRLGGAESVRELARLIRSWPRQGWHRKAEAAVGVLAAMGSELALMQLNRLAGGLPRSTRKAAREHLEGLAAERGLTPERFAERLVPGFGLDHNGTLTLDYGRRRFTAGFDERLKPIVTDEDGRRRKSLPKPGVQDDPVLAPLAHRSFAGLRKDVRLVALDQIRRLEQAMVAGKRWPLAEFRMLFADHPLLWHIARRLVWNGDDGTSRQDFRLAEDRTLADVDDDTLTLAESAMVTVAHPVHLARIGQWAELFADYAILQPFPQLDRPVLALTDEERASTRPLARFQGSTVPTVALLGLERDGWYRSRPGSGGVQPWIARDVPGDRSVVVSLDPGIVVRSPQEQPKQTIESVRLVEHVVDDYPDLSGTMRFALLDTVTASELLTQLTGLAT